MLVGEIYGPLFSLPKFSFLVQTTTKKIFAHRFLCITFLATKQNLRYWVRIVIAYYFSQVCNIILLQKNEMDTHKLIIKGIQSLNLCLRTVRSCINYYSSSSLVPIKGLIFKVLNIDTELCIFFSLKQYDINMVLLLTIHIRINSFQKTRNLSVLTGTINKILPVCIAMGQYKLVWLVCTNHTSSYSILGKA